MSFCVACGHKTEQKIPLGDHKVRRVCTHCGNIHYENPKVICGALALWEDKVLLCRRAIEPRYGLWTLPAGYMELFETMEQGAARETREEAEAEIEIEQLYCMYNIPVLGKFMCCSKPSLKMAFSVLAKKVSNVDCLKNMKSHGVNLPFLVLNTH